MVTPSSKSKILKYLIIIFIVLLISVIFFIFILNNKNFKQSSIEKDNNPSWINKLIEKEKENMVANPPASLIKCFYKDKIVYYIPPRCCDIPSTLYDEKGNTFCHPDGGMTGDGDGKCSDFFKLKEGCVTIWKDTRSR